MRFVFAILVSVTTLPCAAGEIHVEAVPCAPEIGVDVADAKISEVLMQLARRMQLTKFDPSSEALVTMRRRAAPDILSCASC